VSATTSRSLGWTALLAAAVAGLSWATTFPVAALAVPVLAPLLAVLAVDQLTLGRGRAETLRPVAALLVGVVALVAVLQVLNGASVPEIVDGLRDGWRRTLGSTLPARPDADLVAFVPALALLAGVLGIEWGRRGAGPAGTLLPALAVLVLGQLFRAATALVAVATAVAFGVAAGVVLLAGRPRRRVVGRRRSEVLGPQLFATLAVAGLAAWAGAGLNIPGRATFSLQDGRAADVRTITATDPLDQIATLLVTGDRVVFLARADAPVDRWPLVVLDRFDGSNWSADARFLTLGTQLPEPAVTVPLVPARAEISAVDLDGPWLPSQARLRSAEGIRPLVDPATGVLVRTRAPADQYVLQWGDERIDAAGLTASAIDPQPVGGVELDGIPAGITDLARQAVGPDAAPTVQAALVLEKWMKDNYAVATEDLPTGHSYAQLLHFLTVTKRGTSEQFATSYALMARSIGIPVRVVVGFRDDGSGRVHGDDVLAWPEIAVSGLGWVSLDPTGGARSSAEGSGLSAATQAARDKLPSPDQLATQQPGAPPPSLPVSGASGVGIPAWVPALLVAGVVAGGPTAKQVRRAHRRRAAPRQAVVNAWRDTRDVLRDHGVVVPPGSTVRDLTALAPVNREPLDALAGCVDHALWSGRDPDPLVAEQAWAAAATVRRALRAGPLRRRVRAAFTVRTLRPRRAQDAGQLAPRTG
jgi:transglutaminase-like putative cysteine protease